MKNIVISSLMFVALFALTSLKSAAQCTSPTVILSATNPSCDTCCDGSITSFTDVFPPYNIIWSSGHTTMDIPNLCSGAYTLTISYSPDCFGTATVILGNDSTNHFTLISGKIYYDANQNGQYDSSETGMSNLSVTQQPPGTVLYGGYEGNYSNYVTHGNYQLQLNTPAGWHSTSAQTLSITASSSLYQHLDFGIYPDFTTPPQVGAILYNGPALCNSTVPFFIYYYNQGVIPANGVIQYTFDSLMIYDWVNPAPDSTWGNTLLWNYSNLAAYQTAFISIGFTLPAAGNIVSNAALITAVNSSGSVIDSSYFSYETTVVCSFDPNDKIVNPTGEGEQHYTKMNSPLDYTIRFQNTGTAYALKVEIVDTLDDALDINSLQIIDPSHLMTVSLSGRTLRFLFQNIFLPDSNTNEPASHGYVLYRIKPNNNLQEGTIIRNKAHIFFDSNAPVETNSTWNTLSQFSAEAHCSMHKIKVCHNNRTLCVDANAVAAHLSHGDHVGPCPSGREETFEDGHTDFMINAQVFPNPTSGEFTLKFTDTGHNVVSVLVTNTMGNIVYKQKVFSDGQLINLSNVANGLYIITLIIDEKVAQTKVNVLK